MVGEYLALVGGPALILCTAPRFELSVSYSDDEGRAKQSRGVIESLPFDLQSPAGRLAQRFSSQLSSINFRFRDPHMGLGGLGASTAQFALLWATLQVQCGQNMRVAEFVASDWIQLLKLYRECSWSGVGYPPSGADLIAQLYGQVTDWDERLGQANAWTWPFEDLSFTLVRTGNKLATHDHLRQKAEIKEEILRPLVLEAKTAFQDRQSEKLCHAVSEYARALAALGLVSSATSNILEALSATNQQQRFGIRAAKGCGAMGADVVAILYDADQAAQRRLYFWLQSQGLMVCGDNTVLSSGLLSKGS